MLEAQIEQVFLRHEIVVLRVIQLIRKSMKKRNKQTKHLSFVVSCFFIEESIFFLQSK